MSISSIAPVPAAATATPPASTQPPTTASTTAGSPSAVTPASRPVQAGEQAREAQRPETRSPPSTEDLQQALEDVQSAINVVTSDLKFSIDEDTGRTLIKIVDRETDEVIKQIPSEELMRISKALDKLQGLLVKQEA